MSCKSVYEIIKLIICDSPVYKSVSFSEFGTIFISVQNDFKCPCPSAQVGEPFNSAAARDGAATDFY